MKILTASQIRLADAHTIKHEPVSSLKLMERAAGACVHWIIENFFEEPSCKIFCGTGNNGGDGLALARLLSENGFTVQVFIIRFSKKESKDFSANEKRLRKLKNVKVQELISEKDFPGITKDDVVIDALFGTGLSKPVEGLAAKLIARINSSSAKVISIDLPSGLFADVHTEGDAVIHADHTLSFRIPKLAFFFSENEKYVGEWHLLDIGLDEKFISELPSDKKYFTKDFIQSFLKPRRKFSHKGNYGHAFLVAGSEGKMGAAVLAARACLRSGVGLVTAYSELEFNDSFHAACPEAMVTVYINVEKKYSAIGVGPGMGTHNSSKEFLGNLLSKAHQPMVLDADALNIISENKKELLKLIPQDSILTPHPKEFERLAGKSDNDFHRHEMQIEFSKKHKVFVVLKGAHTCVTTPDGKSFFNSTGNAGMAKGGSGDVLTGIITGLLAQGYTPLESSLLGVYMHGLAGDIVATEKGMDGMIAGDIVEAVSEAWKRLRS